MFNNTKYNLSVNPRELALLMLQVKNTQLLQAKKPISDNLLSVRNGSDRNLVTIKVPNVD